MVLVHDPVGKTRRAVDAGHLAVDGPGTLTPPSGPPVDNFANRWTTKPPLTSADGMSSTIHSPYYRHCQNLNSL